MNEAYLIDCMEYMKTLPDKAFDLAVVDPPYGIGDKFKGGKSGKMNFNEVVAKGWDKAPSSEYFNDLFRVSKKSIIWGGNYFRLPPSRAFICWDKGVSENFSLAMCELAWCSFDGLAKIVRLPVPHDGNKIHPTQKPVALYKWILSRYAKPGDKILDTHLGSGSSRIAAYDMGFDFVGCEIEPHIIGRNSRGTRSKILDTHLGSGSSRIAAYDMGFDFVGCEIDKEYFDLQEKRFAEHTAQTRMF